MTEDAIPRPPAGHASRDANFKRSASQRNGRRPPCRCRTPFAIAPYGASDSRVQFGSRNRWSEVVPLPVADAEMPQRGGLAGGLDAFRAEVGAELRGQGDETLDDRATG